MPRPRTPLGKAALTGAAAHNPQRFRDRAEPKSKPLGNPPAWLNDRGKKAWKDFAKEWPWLTASDAAALAPLCVMRATFEEAPESCSAGFFREYRMQLSAFGGNPTTKTKVSAPADEEEDDPFAAFDGKSH